MLITPLTDADTNPDASENETAVEVLIENLANENVSVKSEVVRSLVDIGEPAVAPLIQALENDNPDIRKNSAIALGKIGDERAIEPLLDLLDDDNREVRHAAEIALGNIGEESIDLLVSYAKNQDNAVYSRTIAVIVLGEYGEKAVPSLIQLLSDDEYFLLHPDVRSALNKIGDPAVEPLIGLLDSADPDVKSRAIQTLGDIGDDRAIEPLGKVLNDESEQVRDLAKSAIEAIENQSKDENLSLVSYGKTPDFYIEDERWDFLDKLDIIVTASETEMDKYIRPKGPVYGYGYSYYGYISVGIVADSGANESKLNEIYDIFDRHAQEIGVEDVPVMFEYGDVVAGEGQPVAGEGEPVTQKTPGFTGCLPIMVILLLYGKVRTCP
ncbi:HEAT repeat domain-containing protein [Methanohalophilus sp.]|uniref:HEAT repeat domain-containing protein n=1 Tax=Methanohalophilus sp. TaxID=1966352 RepID=UPI00260B00D1|nr:HEAT repeat domain-containing protein [Methanohalophilus sp.]